MQVLGVHVLQWNVHVSYFPFTPIGIATLFGTGAHSDLILLDVTSLG
jgi:hypothetical protein